MTEPSWRPALAGISLLGVPSSSATYVVLGSVALLAGLSVLFLSWLRRRPAEEDALAGGVTLDMSVFDHPDKAEQQFHQTIRQLQAKIRAGGLGRRGRQALGQACFGEAILLYANDDNVGGRRQVTQARRYIEVTREDILQALARVYVARADESDKAVDVYLSLLQLPAGKADPTTAALVVQAMEQPCRMDDDMATSQVSRRTYVNSMLANLSDAEPRLLIVRGQEPVRRHRLQAATKIGRSQDCDVFLDDQRVSRHHALISRQRDTYVLSDTDSRWGTFIGKTRVKEPTTLSDGDRIHCGDTVLAFHDGPQMLDESVPWTHMNVAKGLLLQQEYALALHKLEEIQATEPQRSEVDHYLGRVNQAMSRFEDAYKAYASALAKDGTRHATHYWWARALVEQVQKSSLPPSGEERHRRLEDAMAHLNQAIKVDPQNDTYAYAKAKVLLLLSKANEAIEALQTAIALKDDDVEYHLLLMRVAKEYDDDVQAQSAGEAVLGLDEHNQEALLLVGNIAYDQEDYAKAAMHFERLRKQEMKLGGSTYTTTLEFAYRFGRSLFEVGKYIVASRVLNAIAKESSSAMLYGARCHSRTGRFDSAAKILRSLLRRYGEIPEARYYLAATLANLRDYDGALEQAVRSGRAKEWAARSLCLSARVLMRTGRLEQAAEHLDKAQRLAPTKEEIYFEKGRLAYLHGDLPEAQTAFNQVLRESPSEARSHLWLGRTFLAEGRIDLARRHFRLALANASHCGYDREQMRTLTADAHFDLGRIGRTEGAYEEATKDLLAARQNGSSAEELALELATCYAETGRDRDALAELSSLPESRRSDPKVTSNMAAIACRMAGAHVKAKRYKEAIPLLQDAAEQYKAVNASNEFEEVNEVLAETHFRLGLEYLSSRNGHLQHSLTAFAQARSLRPDDQQYAYYHGLAHFKNGDFKLACASFEQAAASADDGRATKALALALERAGQSEQAEALWNRLIHRSESDPMARVDAMLGLAGLYSRRGNRSQTASILETVLDDAAVVKHQAYADLCKLAVSYLTLSGNHQAAERIIARHTEGGFADGAEVYLAAVLAQEDRLGEALQHVEEALDAKQKSSEALDLYEAIGRTLAAQKVLAGDVQGAAGDLERITKRVRQPSPETKALLDALHVALSIGGEDPHGSAAARLAVYEKAHKAHRDNPKLLKNLAILNHQVALGFEEGGDFPKAKRYWERGRKVWKQIIDNETFWRLFVESFNEGRSRRDRLNQEDIPRVIKHIVGRLARVHAEFAKLYAAGLANFDRMEWHLRAAKQWQQDKEWRYQLADDIQREAVVKGGNKNKEALVEVLEVVGKELRSDDPQFDTALCNRRLDAASDALERGDIRAFQHQMSIVGRTYRGEADLRTLASNAAQADRSFISDVVRTVRGLFATTPIPPGTNVLLSVVLQMCTLWASVPAFQRQALRKQLGAIVMTVLAEIVKGMAAKR